MPPIANHKSNSHQIRHMIHSQLLVLIEFEAPMTRLLIPYIPLFYSVICSAGNTRSTSQPTSSINRYDLKPNPNMYSLDILPSFNGCALQPTHIDYDVIKMDVMKTA